MAFFTLTQIYGPNWDHSRPRREQDSWEEHATFMDGLVDDGFIILGGPIGDGEQVLHAVEAADEHEVRARLEPDPWATMGLLQIGEIRPWTVWLDGRHRNRTS